MNVDSRVFRRTVRAACTAALVGSVFGGCVSTHKPRFWDQADVSATPSTPAAGATATASTTPPAAPTVVTAVQSTPATPASGHSSAFDLPDALPSSSTGQPTVASASQPATIPSTANDPFADTSESPVITTKPAKPAVTSVASVPAPATSPKAATTPNPFAETDDPVFGTGAQTPRSANSPGRVGTLPPTPPTPASQPVTNATASPPARLASLPATAAKLPPTSPEPEWSAQSDLSSTSATSSTTPAPAAPQTTPVAAATRTNDSYDAFADPVPPTQAKAPVAPPAVEAADNRPTCAAPVANAVAPSQTAAALPATAADPSAAKAAFPPTRAPASLDQTVSQAASKSSEPIQVVIPVVKSAASSKAVPATPQTKAASASVEKVSAAKVDSGLDWDVAKPQAAVQSPSAVTSAMICDTKSVRGRFTGASCKAEKASPQVEPLFQKIAPAALPAAPALPAPVKEAPPKPPEQPAAPLPSAEAVKPAPQPTQATKAADQAACEPAKPATGVVNAIAQVGQSSALDPFALEQTVDNSPAEALHPAHTPAPAKAEVAPPLPTDESPFDPASIQLTDAMPVAAPNPPHESASMPVATWFAIGLGMGVGLAVTLGVWLRLRRKPALPESEEESLKAAA